VSSWQLIVPTAATRGQPIHKRDTKITKVTLVEDKLTCQKDVLKFKSSKVQKLNDLNGKGKTKDSE
jgi:hypothetical protein